MPVRIKGPILPTLLVTQIQERNESLVNYAASQVMGPLIVSRGETILITHQGAEIPGPILAKPT